MWLFILLDNSHDYFDPELASFGIVIDNKRKIKFEPQYFSKY